jgi:hypothetical protein
MWAWLKERWVYLAVLAGFALTFLAGRGVKWSELKAALAFRKLNDATAAHLKAEAEAARLKQHSEQLAEQVLVEELVLSTKKQELAAKDHGAVVLELKRRKILK